MTSTKIKLDGYEDFDGIVEKILVENDLKRTTIIVKQWEIDEYSLSELQFNDVIFQSLPDISSFNLLDDITKLNDTQSIVAQLEEYLANNPTLMLANHKDNIINDIKENPNLVSYFLASRYCKDWFIICAEMLQTDQTFEKKN